MYKLKLKPSFLRILYLIIFLILFSSIIYTPTLIKGPLHLSEKFKIEEETIESFLLAILFFLSFLIFNLYKQEVYKHKELIKKIQKDKQIVEEKLNDSFQYIGVLNVQIQEIKLIFNSIDNYPETKAGLKKTFIFFGKRILGIVNSNWVLIRIIDSTTQRTIIEHLEKRPGFSTDYPHVSNKMIIEKQTIINFTSVISNPKNLNIHVCCIMPVDNISKEQRIFILAIINEIAKLFVILNSSFHKKTNKIFTEDKPGKT